MIKLIKKLFLVVLVVSISVVFLRGNAENNIYENKILQRIEELFDVRLGPVEILLEHSNYNARDRETLLIIHYSRSLSDSNRKKIQTSAQWLQRNISIDDIDEFLESHLRHLFDLGKVYYKTETDYDWLFWNGTYTVDGEPDEAFSKVKTIAFLDEQERIIMVFEQH